MGALVAAGAVALAVGSPAFDPVRHAWSEGEHRELRGTWVAAAGVRDGTPFTKADLARVRLTFSGPQDGTRYTITNVRCLTDDPADRPTSFLVMPWLGPGGFELCRQHGVCSSCYPGWYERTGDTLRLCVDLRFHPDGLPRRVRPTAFAAPAGSGLTLLTLVREKP